ncbi:MAG: peptidase M28 [Pseudopedobacter saltans]|uniref:Peptidase M28 n=1 Tax=Pseudopedobacter saltans TaxID=151895 RepID=A0A2W5FBY5_9SPHI|nr:MAG: peptidase M28 [Pseudopedobacter saltans]
MKKQLLSVVLLISTAAIAQKQVPIEKFAKTISPKELKAKLKVVASAEMEGRETATPGQKRAATYIENFFKKIGLEPGAADGKYQMTYPVYQDSLINASFQINNRNLLLGKDYELAANSLNNGNWNSQSIVFAGYGSTDSINNDFKNLDIKDKWVLLLEGLPAGIQAKGSPFRINGMKASYARSKGALGVIFISSKLPKGLAEDPKGNMYLKKMNTKPFPVIYINGNTAASILNSADTALSALSRVAKKDYNTASSLSVTATTINLESSNVLGVLPGTDKKGEYLFITGHYDHLGKKGDVIYYGADDDGSGTVSVMQIAQAFVNAKKKGYGPRRTIVFMTVSGEEKGLWGSEYFSEHPTVPLDSVSADLNVDMDGRIDTERKTADSLNYIYVIGHDKLSSELQPINEGANNKYTQLVLDYKFDDPKDPNRIYYRSDHYNFAKKGVPILFFYDGMLKADYHQPTDTVDKINFDLMSKRAKMIFFTGWDIANRDALLKRDIPLK